MAQLDIVLAVEQQFAIRLSNGDIDSIKSVDDLVGVISRK
jgi:acyl carrier protein